MNILLVEDDKDLKNSMKILLRNEGYNVETAENGELAIKKFTGKEHILILDINLPDMSGFELCRHFRKISNVPILFLTAKSLSEDKEEGFLCGGDDYIVKPFIFEELLTRIKALIRRYTVYGGSDNSEEDDYIQCSGVRIHKSDVTVMVGEKSIKLTNTEHKILLLLISNPSKIFSLPEIHKVLWNEPFEKQNRAAIVVHVKNLRTKIDPEGVYIQTVWGKGYRFIRHDE